MNEIYEEKINDLKFINFSTDFMFKTILTSRRGRKFLKALLENILHIKIDSEIIIKNNELNKRFKNEKSKRTDILVEVNNYSINLEMNSEYSHQLANKNGTYLSYLHSIRYKPGESYQNDKIVFQINFDLYDYFNKNQLVYECKLMDTSYYLVEDISYVKYHINVAYFKDKSYNVSELNKLERLVGIIGSSSFKEIDELSLGDRVMEETVSFMKGITSEEWAQGIY
ncbi:MAG: PD-(D/E)XK nuclease family transposase, partial [Bacilli bacterium]